MSADFEARITAAIRFLMNYIAIPNDAILRVEAHLTGEPYQPKDTTPGDPRALEIARLTREIEALKAGNPQSSSPEAASAPQPTSAVAREEGLSDAGQSQSASDTAAASARPRKRSKKKPA